jgi:hypothetical protein
MSTGQAPAQAEANTSAPIEQPQSPSVENSKNSGTGSDSREEAPPSSPTPSLNLEAARPSSRDTNNPAGSADDSWLYKRGRSIRQSWPKTSRMAVRICQFLRGPSPRVPLPRMHFFAISHFYLTSVAALNPWLDRIYNVRGHALTVRLESTVIKYTRPVQRAPLFWIFVVGYIIAFAFFARANYFLTPVDSFVGCTSTYWLALNGCGLDGVNCAPFTNATYEFRCPAQCRSVPLANPRTVGVEEPVYVPLVVGGGDAQKTYRSDSFICAAAIHA